VTYTVTDPTDGVSIEIEVNGDTLTVGSGSGSIGTHTATVTYPEQPAGTVLVAEVLDANEFGERTAPTPCTTLAPDWDGFGDGRLNPDPAEPYSVYCNSAGIEVWVIRQPNAPLALLEWSAVPVTDVQWVLVRNGVTFRREGDATQVSGTNGNYQPQFGHKDFAWAACAASRPASAPLPEEPPADVAGGSGTGGFSSTFWCFPSPAAAGIILVGVTALGKRRRSLHL
jgi:hypothetical protein